MEKEKKYFKELRKKVDIYFVIILSMLSSLSIYILYEGKILNQENIYVLMAVLTISFIVYIFSIKENFKSKNINELDKAIFFSNIFLITSLFMFIIIKSINNKDLLLIYNLTKRLIQGSISISFAVIITSVIFALIVLSLILISTRSYLYKKVKSPKENYKKVCTLWDIYTGNFNDKDLKNLKIEDSDKIEHDLFGRTPIVANLYDSITNFKEHSDCFTIGVVGEWGSGKSSIIELTKNKILSEKFKNNFIIIDDFDPWAIKSQDALILAMYNTIMENLGENISYFRRKKIESALINITTNIPYIGKGIGSFFENRIDDYTEYKEIKADLEEKLEKFDKRLIFIIDNLDRMNSENVLFLLTLIGTLFKLPNITYIVAYDKYRLKTIFRTDKIDSKYIEKIINQEILIPKIHPSNKQYIFYTCLKNCIKTNIEFLSIIDKKILEEFDNCILRKITSKFNNIRDFIRFLNFINYDMNTTFSFEYENTFLILKTIQFLDNKLYIQLFKIKKLITHESNQNLNEEKHKIYQELERSNLFDLLELIPFKNSTYDNLNDSDPYLVKNVEEFLDNWLNFCNSIYFDNLFSTTVYNFVEIEIKELFSKMPFTYNTIIDIFNKNKIYLDSFFIFFLGLNLWGVDNLNYDLSCLKIYTLVFFIDKIKNNELKKEYEKYFLENFDKNYKNKTEIIKIQKSTYDQLFEAIQNLFDSILNSKAFYNINKYSKIFKNNTNFKTFISNIESNNENNTKIIKNCIEIASNNHITQKEQIEKIQQELEVLFKNNIKK